MSRFSGPQFRGAQRQMKLQRRAEAEKRQAISKERMKALTPLLGVVMAEEESERYIEYGENQEMFYPVEVEVKKTRVRRRGKHVAAEAE